MSFSSIVVSRMKQSQKRSPFWVVVIVHHLLLVCSAKRSPFSVARHQRFLDVEFVIHCHVSLLLLFVLLLLLVLNGAMEDEVEKKKKKKE